MLVPCAGPAAQVFGQALPVCARNCMRAALRHGARCASAARSWQLCLDLAANGVAPGRKDLQVRERRRTPKHRAMPLEPVASPDGKWTLDPALSSVPHIVLSPSALCRPRCEVHCGALCPQVLVLGNGCAGAENQSVGLLLQMLHAARGKCNLHPGVRSPLCVGCAP